MKKSLLFLVLLLIINLAQAQSEQEIIHKTGTFKNTGNHRVLAIENIHGFVHVEAYAGDKVELKAEKKISGRNQQEVDKGMQEVAVKLKEAGDSIYVYIDAPFIYRKKPRSRNIEINLEDIGYRYEVDLTLRVPANLNLDLSTVNNGDLTVTDVTGDINAHHVNGPIILTGVVGKAEARTVNGRIDIFYKKNPTADSRFKTINGNVNIYYAPKINATVAFKSMHGQFYTDLTDVEMMPIQVVKNTDNRGEGTIYKIDKSNSYKLGNGGPALSFETLNGNIYLKKNTQ